MLLAETIEEQDRLCIRLFGGIVVALMHELPDDRLTRAIIDSTAKIFAVTWMERISVPPPTEPASMLIAALTATGRLLSSGELLASKVDHWEAEIKAADSKSLLVAFKYPEEIAAIAKRAILMARRGALYPAITTAAEQILEATSTE